MRVLFVSASATFFNAHYAKLLNVCQRMGETHAALPADDPQALRRTAEAGVAVHPVRLSRGGGIVPLALEVASLRRVLTSLRPDIVVPITIKATLVAALANRLAHGGRLLALLTGLGHLFIGNSLPQKALRRAVTMALARSFAHTPHLLVFSNADDLADGVAHGFAMARYSRVIPLPGVDVRRFMPSPEPAAGFRVALPARMLREKGIEEFVAAAARLKPQLPGASFLLAGGIDAVNPSRVSPRALRRWVGEGNVEWLGHVDDMPALFASCHAVVLPSYREGFPLALAEAMACGRPIVATDVPGCRDAVGDGERGILVPPRDAAKLADAIAYLHERPEMRRAMGTAGRLFVERQLDEESVISNFADALRELAE